jgi:DHA2 family multidrug resistance protein-like MFS transporter
MLALVILGPKVLPEFKNPQPGKLDFASVALSLLALLPIIYGIKQLAKDGWQVVPIISLVLGLAFGVAFVRRQRRLADPLLDLSLFTHRTIGTTLINQLSYSMMGGGLMLLLMMYFQLVHGLSTVQAGLVMVPGMLAGALGFQVAPKLANRIRPAYVIAGGMGLAAICYAILTQISTTGGGTVLVIGFALISFFGSPTVALGTNLVVTSAPMEKMGSAGSLAQLSNEFGGTLGLALLGTLAATVYRGNVTLPTGLSAQAAATAHDSLAGAVTTAASLPDAEAGTVLTAAGNAFTSGLHTVAAVGAVLFAVMAVFVGTRLRHVPAFGAPQAAAPAAEPTVAEEETVLD